MIAVDDGSTDATPHILGSYGDKIKVLRQRNRGPPAARNAGAAAASPDSQYFVFLDADDVLLPPMLKRLTAELDAAPSVALAFDPPSLKQRARGRLAMVHASVACLQAVELLYKANGGSSVYTGNVFDRWLRDMQTANQHAVVSLKTWETTGRVLLGLEPDSPLF